MNPENKKRRSLGEHLTSISIFKKYIFPEIKDMLYDYVWVDLYAGKGNLILPILEHIPIKQRESFFQEHIFLFDVQENLVRIAIENAMKYGISRRLAEKNIILQNTFELYPDFLLNLSNPVYHITNPPYLYIGYIVKHKETQKYLQYFEKENQGYQDLYQLALMNDLRHGLENMIYIIPSNFLFGASVSNKIRKDFLYHYTINKAYIFERKIFDFTGTNVVICFFKRKKNPSATVIEFKAKKINDSLKDVSYSLDPKYNYRAGSSFDIFVNEYKSNSKIKIKFYLTIDEVNKNLGNYKLEVIDANEFRSSKYKPHTLYVNEKLYRKIKSNILFVRTVDTGSFDGRAGLYRIDEVFNVSGILVSRAKYRTHPIQIFFEPMIPLKKQLLLKDYFNLVLEYLRKKTGSDFMTTYKYSNSKYIRKYLGLSQVKKLIQTFPVDLTGSDLNEFSNLIKNKDVSKLLLFLNKVKAV